MIRALLFWLLFASAAFGVEPDEVLEDPALEARARELSKGLRCLVCRNESIDESNAELARDLRLLVRERLLMGESDAEVIAFLVARFGEYVLLTPQRDGANLILWAAAPVLFLAGLGVAVGYIRRREHEELAPLSQEDADRLDALLNENKHDFRSG